MPPASRGWFRRLQLCSLAISKRRAYSTSVFPEKISLRAYQEDCIQTVLTNLKEGHKRLGISLATGAGKTIIFTQLIDRVEPRGEDANQTLILAHRQELVDQAARHCLHAYADKKVEIEMGIMHASGFADITVASIQSLRSVTRISKFDPSRFKLVLVDEAHHIVSSSYMKILKYFGLDEAQENSPALVGVSATFSRSDGVKLGAAIDQIVYHKDYLEMIEEKWLSDVMFTTVESQADITNVKSGSNGDYQTRELSEAVNTEQTNDITVRSWMEKCGERKSTLVFCVDLDHVFDLTNTFRRHGIDARSITGLTKKAERSDQLDSFRKGDFPVLVNCGVFTEGTDIPNIDCVLLARPTRSRNLLIQMIGRGMRLSPGKENCHILDMVASLTQGIVTTPTLFGLDPNELVAKATPEQMKDRAKKKEDEQVEREKRAHDKTQRSATGSDAEVTVTFTDYDSIFDFISDSSGEQHIRKISPNAWVCVGEQNYVLTTLNGNYLKIQRLGSSMYEVTETEVFKTITRKRVSLPPKLKATADSLLNAVHAADTYARDKYPVNIISYYHPWRKLPASEAQIEFLNKFRPEEDPLTPENTSRGKAGDMITKIKHGARGRFSKLKSERKRVERKQLKLAHQAAKQLNETVRVGPVLA
ncbi:putative ATP-dependent helicase [Podosphaera aphanis]|nr:putative ATP-dependent helicase [Podosphaera aphanis]